MRRNQPSGPPKLAVVAAVAAVGGVVGVLLNRLGRSRRHGAGGRRQPRRAEERTWRCECGQEFRVVGEDRHRVYWLIDADRSDPVLDGRCPNCGRPLPGQQAAEAA